MIKAMHKQKRKNAVLLTTITAKTVGDGLSTRCYYSELLWFASDLEIDTGDDDIVAVRRTGVVTTVITMTQCLG